MPIALGSIIGGGASVSVSMFTLCGISEGLTSLIPTMLLWAAAELTCGGAGGRAAGGAGASSGASNVSRGNPWV